MKYVVWRCIGLHRIPIGAYKPNDIWYICHDPSDIGDEDEELLRKAEADMHEEERSEGVQPAPSASLAGMHDAQEERWPSRSTVATPRRTHSFVRRIFSLSSAFGLLACMVDPLYL